MSLWRNKQMTNWCCQSLLNVNMCIHFVLSVVKKINISLFDWTGASSITVLLPTFLYDWLARQLLEKFIKFGSPLSKWQLTIRVFVKVCFQMFISSLEFSLHMRARPDVTGESLMVQTRMNHGIFVVLWSQVS